MGNNENSCRCINIDHKNIKKQSSIIEVLNNDVNIHGSLNFQKQSTFKKLQIAANQLCISIFYYYTKIQGSGIGILYNPLIMRMLAYQQDNIFKAFSLLSKQNRLSFINRMGEINFDEMDSLYQNLIINQDHKKFIHQILTNLMMIQSCHGFEVEKMKIQDKFDVRNKGYSLLCQNRVAIVLMCAGSSSRFFFQDKFLHPLELFQKQELLAILLKRLRNNLQAKKSTQIINQTIIIIGNELNIEKIEKYMKDHNFFYFNKEQIYFTEIPSLPILDQEGKICLNFQYNYLRRPKGSGCCLDTLISTQAVQILIKQGIEYVHFVGCENIAENPGDPIFIGLTHLLKRQIAIKCTDIKNPFEDFDRIVTSHKKIHILDKMSLETIAKQKQDLWTSPIAMNSLIFSINSLKNIKHDFYSKLELAKLYRCNIISQSYYDFSKRKPLIGRKCYSFQKDIRDFISTSKAPLIVKVDRRQFIPIITLKNQYSVVQASECYKKYYKDHKEYKQ